MWPDIVFPPINLWSIPYIWTDYKENTVISSITYSFPSTKNPGRYLSAYLDKIKSCLQEAYPEAIIEITSGKKDTLTIILHDNGKEREANYIKEHKYFSDVYTIISSVWTYL